MDLGLGQFEMVLIIGAVTQLLKMYVLDFLPVKWGKRNKATVALCFIATAGVIWLNYPGLPLREFIRATLFYGLSAGGLYATAKGSSMKLKNANKF